jgi:HEAT repeat protein
VTIPQSALHWILSLAFAAFIELGLAMIVIHAWRRRSIRVRGEAMGRLSLAFARYGTGSTSAAELCAKIDRVSAKEFWETLENYADAVSGNEWSRLAYVVSQLPKVRQEARNLSHRDAWRRALAARHMGMLSVAAPLDRLRAAMVGGPMIVTFTAALALARAHDREALRWLLAHPKATQSQDRHRLTALLKRFGPEFAAELRESLDRGTDEHQIGLATIEVLGIFRDEESRERLEAILRQAGLEARASAARALGAIGSGDSVPALCEALKDPDWRVRAQAASSLGAAPFDSAVEPLLLATSDSSWWVRRNTAYALARHGEPGLDALLRLSQLSPDRYVREMSVEVLQMLEWESVSHGGLSRVE